MLRHLSMFALAAALAAGCSTTPTDPYADHDEASDFDPVPGDGKADGLDSFNMNNVYSDDYLTDEFAMDAAGIQKFFEKTPYGTRSWLANASVDGVTVAEAVVAAAQAEHINPLVLVARMQVESSLVSKTSVPSQRSQDQALGCGCPDGGGCSASYRGLGKQFSCAAKVLRRWYDASIDGSGQYRKGHSTRTLDPRTVTPTTNATASLYAYTPWVLVGSGGTWLVWNVTKKYQRWAVSQGLLVPTTPI